MKLDRQQAIAVGTLLLLGAFCVFALSWSLEMRSAAAQELLQRSEALSQMEARLKGGARRAAGTAPLAAFIEAQTQGLASAQLHSYFAQLAAGQSAVLASLSEEARKPEDPPDSIRAQASIDVSSNALQAMIHQLESGTPYVFIESLAVSLLAGNAQGAVQDPLLRATLVLRASWRRGPA